MRQGVHLGLSSINRSSTSLLSSHQQFLSLLISLVISFLSPSSFICLISSTIMGAITTSDEVASSLPAGKLYKGFFLDIDNILPKILPGFIKSADIEGDGGVGTIKNLTLGEEGKIVSMKQRIDVVDKEGLTFGTTIIGGDILLGKLESIVSQFAIVPTDGGCIFKVTTTYNPIGDAVVPEDKVQEATERSGQLFKAVEAYILANLDAY